MEEKRMCGQPMVFSGRKFCLSIALFTGTAIFAIAGSALLYVGWYGLGGLFVAASSVGAWRLC